MSEDPMSPERDGGAGTWPGETEVHAAPGGAVEAALAWMELLRAGRLADAWLRMDNPFRLYLARYWCWRHRFTLSDAGYEPFDVATGLADDGPVHPVWPAFARSQTPDVSPEQVLAGGWLAAGPPEPAGPDLEIVRLSPADRELGGDDPPFTLVLCFGSSGWLVAGHGESPARPHWPPG
jgi:hypothetical protein